jgi:hypothetical protein
LVTNFYLITGDLMSNCVIRVELHNARTSQVYEALHQLMAIHGMHGSIVATNGRRYKLPPAEYYYAGNSSRDAILAAAKQCAAQVDRSYAVVVSDTNSVTWDGLQPM